MLLMPRSTSTTSLSADDVPAATKRRRRAPRASIPSAARVWADANSSEDESDGHGLDHRPRVRAPPVVSSHPPAKRAKSVRLKHRPEPRRGSDTAAMSHGGAPKGAARSASVVADSGRSGLDNFIVHDSASEGLDTDDGEAAPSPPSPLSDPPARTPPHGDHVYHSSGNTRVQPLPPQADGAVPLLQGRAGGVGASPGDGSQHYAVIDVKIADNIGSVQLARMDRDATGADVLHGSHVMDTHDTPMLLWSLRYILMRLHVSDVASLG